MSLAAPLKSKPQIPYHQSYLENEAEVEKRINDLTKMLKEKIEQILLVEKRTKNLDELIEKNFLGEARLRHDYDNFKLYQGEHRVLEKELLEMKGQILLNNARISEFGGIDGDLRGARMKVGDLTGR